MALPFQSWRRFKEAFAPELISLAFDESEIDVKVCIDPFSGSGTTALASQFLGLHPIAVEVNPFLADVAEAKLATYNINLLRLDCSEVLKRARRFRRDPYSLFRNAPKTMVEPGYKDRWILNFDVATELANLRAAIDLIEDQSHKRLFRVLLGGVLVTASNVITSGKGRRYRRNWQSRDTPSLLHAFAKSVESAIAEIEQFASRRSLSFEMIRGDARSELLRVKSADLAVFSPPYPNSFDYTDVYNLELWGLGYLTDKLENQTLRTSTLSSHVQIGRDFTPAPGASKRLQRTLSRLEHARLDLWSDWIPEMIGGYFADMYEILAHLHRIITPRGSAWMVVGDSQYAGIKVRVAAILADLAASIGWLVDRVEPVRSMRSSAQQGGEASLTENLIVLRRG